METIPLNPRDIQTRIRRGESAQQVAEAAGVPVERIEMFAGPVIAEREYMVEQARKTSLRRKHVSGAAVVLGVLVDSELIESGSSPEKTTWDSWRREDGRWSVVVTPDGSETTATFIYDVAGRYVIPADETAHDLVGDIPLSSTPDMAIAEVVRREAPVATPPAEPSQVEHTIELDLDDEPVGDVQTEIEYVESPDGGLQLPADIAAAEALLSSTADPVSAVSSLKDARDRRAHEALARQEAKAKKESEAPAQSEPATDHLEDSLESDVAVPDTAGPRKKRERRRVPSWDEIMFGDKGD